MKIVQICPPHLPDVATLPWEIQKSHFQQYLYILLTIYVMCEHGKDGEEQGDERGRPKVCGVSKALKAREASLNLVRQ